MRYFAHDGSTTHGPASVEELTARPWFDGDVLVCPVGSQDSGDWKPALAYPAFKQALLAPKKAPPPPPPLAPAIALKPCPFCQAANLEAAHFCNECGKRMDGLPPAPEPAPMPVFAPAPAYEPPAAFTPATEPEPLLPAAPLYEPPRAYEPSPEAEPLRPMERPPERSGPMSRPLAAFSSPEPEPAAVVEPASDHTFASLASELPHPIEPARSLMPDYPGETEAPAAEPQASVTPPRRGALVLAAVAGVAALSAAAGWLALRPAPAPTAGGDLILSAPIAAQPGASASSAPMEPASADAIPASPPAASPSPTSRPARTPKRAKTGGTAVMPNDAAAPRPRRSRRTASPAPVEPPEEPADAILIESRAAADEPMVPGARPDQPLGDPDAAPAASPSEFLPGIPRKPGLKAPRPKATAKPASDADASALDAALDTAPAAKASGAVKTAANPADALALQQAVEEFEFCAQLLAQGAYADHFDTCLCKETRQKAPYRNRRGFYASSLEKEAAAGRLEVSAEIVSTRMVDGAARIVAKWKSKGSDPGREVDETWIMDDGLWCKAP